MYLDFFLDFIVVSNGRVLLVLHNYPVRQRNTKVFSGNEQ